MLTGDWEGVQKRLRNLATGLESNVRQATAKNIAMVESTVVGHLQSQDLDWAPLSKGYADYKARTRDRKWRSRRRKSGVRVPRRLSEKSLIATGRFMKAITSHQLSPFMGEIGVKKTRKYAGGEKIANIGAMLEDGTSKMPARKLWKPSLDEIEKDVLDNYTDVIKRLVYVV